MAFQLSPDIDLDSIDGCCFPTIYHPANLHKINVNLVLDETLNQRAYKIFRSRRYNHKRSIGDRINGRKPGRRPKLKQVQANER